VSSCRDKAFRAAGRLRDRMRMLPECGAGTFVTFMAGACALEYAYRCARRSEIRGLGRKRGILEVFGMPGLLRNLMSKGNRTLNCFKIVSTDPRKHSAQQWRILACTVISRGNNIWGSSWEGSYDHVRLPFTTTVRLRTSRHTFQISRGC
jgi:hypothetical protein